MLPIKLKYQRCPNCKKYGLPAWNKTYRNHNKIHRCPYCENFYKVNIFLSTMARILLLFVICFIEISINKLFAVKISAALITLIIAIFYCLMLFLLPYEKIYDDEVPSYAKKNASKRAEEILIELRTEQVISKQNLFINLLVSYVIILSLTLLIFEEYLALSELNILALIVTAIYIVIAPICFIWRDKAEKKWKSKRTSTYQVEQIDTEDHE